MLEFLLALVAQVPAPEGPLDRAAALAHGLRSCTARYTVAATSHTPATDIRFDYVAPDRVRVDRVSGGKRTSTWSVDGVLALDSTEGPQPARGRSDTAALRAERLPLEEALARAFPAARPRAELAAAIGLSWNFDGTSRRATWALEAQVRAPDATPLGWLDTLRRKGAAATVDGTLLRYVTDGSCTVLVSQGTGFLQSLSAPGPEGELRLALVSVDVDVDVDRARFVLPEPAPGLADVGDALTRAVRRVEDLDLRARIYAAAASGDPTESWDAEDLARIDSVLEPFLAHTVAHALRPWLERSVTVHATIAERLRKLRASGRPAEDVEAERGKERGFLEQQLDDLEQGFLTRLAVPEGSHPRGAALLAREKHVLSGVFRGRVREPVLDGFEAATKP